MSINARRIPAVCLAALLACTLAHAQAPTAPATDAKTWAYDVISIKPSKSTEDRMMMRVAPGGVTANNMPLSELVSSAYGIKSDLISGLPGWADNAHFDVEAKATPEDSAALDKLPQEQRNATRRQMMQALLADRFKLKARVETKELPVYYLVVAKGGFKIKEATPGFDYPNGFKGPDGKKAAGMMRFDGSSFTAQGVEISGLVNNLAFQVHRTVIDKTGLKGKYDFTLKFAPETAAPSGADNGTSDDSPSIFAALEEQLGLKLINSKGPVDTLVVEHLEQPTEN